MKIQYLLVTFLFTILLVSFTTAATLWRRETLSKSLDSSTQQPASIDVNSNPSSSDSASTDSTPQALTSTDPTDDSSSTAAETDPSTATPSATTDSATEAAESSGDNPPRSLASNPSSSPPPPNVTNASTPSTSTPAASPDSSSNPSAPDAADSSNSSATPNTTSTTPPSNPFVFDFFNPPPNATVTAGPDGASVIGDNISFPYIGWDALSMGMEFIGPCGLDPPHLHPGADELALVISGEFYTGFITANAAPLVINFLTPGLMTLFARGSIHWLANLSCRPALYVSAFDSGQPLVLDIAQNMYRFPDDILDPSMGYPDEWITDAIRDHIPQNITLGIEECLVRCGIERPIEVIPIDAGLVGATTVEGSSFSVTSSDVSSIEVISS